MKNVMTKAWEIAREGQKEFGGKVKEYFAEALKMAWKIIKKVSTLDEKYNKIKFMVKSTSLDFYGKVDEYFLKATEMIQFTGMTEKEFKNEIQYVDPSRATSFDWEVNGIICEVVVAYKYNHEM